MLQRLLTISGHKGQDLQMSLLAHIISNSSVGDMCWEWRGAKARANYGMLRVDKRALLVHRVMAHLAYGLDLKRTDLFVCHRCDNSKCFNPRHLFVGTQKDNLADMIKKGRAKKTRAKPTKRDITLMRAYEAGKSLKQSAQAAGYSHSYASQILFMAQYRAKWVSTGQYTPKNRG